MQSNDSIPQQPQHVESEVKLFVGDRLETIRAQLMQAGAELAKPRVHEYNVRYDDPAGSFMRNDIVLRLRRDARVRLTFKAPPDPGTEQAEGIRTRFEAEVGVDDFDTMNTILQRLGLIAHRVYEKYRTTLTLQTDADVVEIVLDEMPYGNFIEVEGAPTAIEAALKQVNLQGEPRILISYMMLFDMVQRALNIKLQDLTFENFEGIAVPPAIFLDAAYPPSQS